MNAINGKRYQERELHQFTTDQRGYHDTAREFSDSIAEAGREWVEEQINWIASGDYGVGACLALQRARSWGEESKRRNTEAAVGRVVIKAMAGREYAWGRLTDGARDVLSASVSAWLKSAPHYAITSII